MSSARPVGTVTRGTTTPNRLRRCDRWLVHRLAPVLRRAPGRPDVVDLGYGASPVTVLELRRRLAAVRSDVRVTGIEIDPARVAAGQALGDPQVDFRLGGFEIPLDSRRPLVVRAFNVLRQYDEDEVPAAWERVLGRLADEGVLVEGTCDEIGRVASWVTLDRGGPRSLTISLHLGSLTDPAVVAERLPKALIHRNHPGERVHEVLASLSDAWHRASPYAAYGARQRFVAAVALLQGQGVRLLDDPRRWRLGELTLDWAEVAPGPGSAPQTPGAAR